MHAWKLKLLSYGSKEVGLQLAVHFKCASTRTGLGHLMELCVSVLLLLHV
jgi:hypothetical protein